MTVSELRTLVDNLEEYIHVPGGIDRLKKMVLHLAVSGQLVSQDPSEGTGEELYRKIQAEKAELLKQGKLKIQKTLPEVGEDEVPFMIPKSWKWVRPGDIGQINPRNSISDETEVGFIPMTMVSERYGKLPDFETREWSSVKKNFTHFANNDVILAKITPCFENSKAGVVKGLPNGYGAGTTELHVFRQEVRFICPDFFYLWIKNPLYIQIGKTKMTGSAGQKRVPTNYFKTFPMPLPPITEQKRIVAKVDSIFELIDQLSIGYRAEQTERSKLVASSLAQLAKAENDVEDSLALTHLSEIIRTKADAKILRQTILHLAVSGQLVPQDPSEGTGEALYQQIQVEKLELIKRGKLKKQKPLPTIDDDEALFTIPSDWKWARLGDLSDIFNGNSINASEKKLKYEKVTDGYPYIATKDIGYGFENVDYENGVKIPFSEDKFKIISEGTALICSEGGSAGKKCGIVDRDVAFGNKMYAFKAFGGLILPEFVLYNYLSKQFYEQFSGKMTGIIGGISTASFKQLLMPLPSLAEQKRIVAKTTQLLDLVSELEKYLEK